MDRVIFVIRFTNGTYLTTNNWRAGTFKQARIYTRLDFANRSAKELRLKKGEFTIIPIDVKDPYPPKIETQAMYSMMPKS